MANRYRYSHATGHGLDRKAREGAAMDLVPYTPMQPQISQPLAPGTNQAVHITMAESDLDWMLAKFERWFAGRAEIIQIANGTSDKIGTGWVLLEWEGCAIDQLFLKILEEEERVLDFTVYDREED
jgi:hypothetical protein